MGACRRPPFPKAEGVNEWSQPVSRSLGTSFKEVQVWPSWSATRPFDSQCGGQEIQGVRFPLLLPKGVSCCLRPGICADACGRLFSSGSLADHLLLVMAFVLARFTKLVT